ncbi:MAG TPA: papain-like cysteine protease family protein [Thermoanaerobaculia bacterium]|nr:papain-like cysteine protease family protein [Thermoanaerobaculia bacterium]
MTKSWRTMALVFMTSLFVSASAFSQYPSPVDIPIQNIPQETPEWCWAAVAQQIILASVGLQQTPPQCALVAMANNAPPEVCCSGNPACVRTGSVQQIQFLIGRFGRHASSLAPPTDPFTLYNTLAANRPVILQVMSGPGTTHVVVLRGMSFVPTPQGPMPVLYINDPMAIYTQPVPYFNLLRIWVNAIVVN